MKYKVDGITYCALEDVILCIRYEVKEAKKENKKKFTIETNSFE